MKKIIEVSIGSVNFEMEEDAYYKLKDYLARFEANIGDKKEAKEVMEDVEARIAELFHDEKQYTEQVITLKFVDMVIERLGEMPYNNTNRDDSFESYEDVIIEKRFYRDPDDKKIAGVCSGIATYFSIDVTLVRILFLILALFGFGSACIVYIIIWIATKQAYSFTQKLQMRGIPVTAENIIKYKNRYYGSN